MTGWAYLHEDGEGERGTRFKTVSLSLNAGLWRKLASLAKAEKLPLSILGWIAFSSMLDRLSDGSVRLWFLYGRRGADLPDAAMLQRPVGPDDISSAVRKTLAMCSDATRFGERTFREPGEAIYLFEYRGADPILPDSLGSPAPKERPARGRAARSQERCKLKFVLQAPAKNTSGKMQITVDLTAFSVARARSLLAAYVHLLEEVLAAPQAPLGSHSLAASHDRAHSIEVRKRNPHSAFFDLPADLPALFNTIVKRWPDRTAIAWPAGTMTFADVASAAAALAGMFRKGGLCPAILLPFGSRAPRRRRAKCFTCARWLQRSSWDARSCRSASKSLRHRL